MNRRRKRRNTRAAVQRRFVCSTVIAGIAVVLVTSFLLFGITSHADEPGTQLHKYYKSVLVIDEASLSEIVEEYAATGNYRNVRAYLREVREINHVPMKDENTLKVAPGNYLILPYYSTEIM